MAMCRHGDMAELVLSSTPTRLALLADSCGHSSGAWLYHPFTTSRSLTRLLEGCHLGISIAIEHHMHGGVVTSVLSTKPSLVVPGIARGNAFSCSALSKRDSIELKPA